VVTFGCHYDGHYGGHYGAQASVVASMVVTCLLPIDHHGYYFLSSFGFARMRGLR